MPYICQYHSENNPVLLVWSHTNTKDELLSLTLTLYHDQEKNIMGLLETQDLVIWISLF